MGEARIISNPKLCLERAESTLEEAEEFCEWEATREQNLTQELWEAKLKLMLGEEDVVGENCDEQVGQGSLAADLRALRVHSSSFGVNAAGEGTGSIVDNFVEASCAEKVAGESLTERAASGDASTRLSKNQ